MLAPDFDGIDDVMKAESRWVLWRLEWTNDRWAKVPYQPSGRRAKPNDPITWSSFAVAVNAYRQGGFDGVGFALGDGWVGGDMDNCRNPDSGELSGVSQILLAAFATYAEVSPSGTGVMYGKKRPWYWPFGGK